MMRTISEIIADIFKNLNSWNSIIQNQVQDYYSAERFSACSTSKTMLTDEEVRAVDEQALAQKMCEKTALTPAEIFIIKQLFQPYIIEIRERDSRIYEAICLALASQREKRIISDKRFTEEMKNLFEWYSYAKGLYQ